MIPFRCSLFVLFLAAGCAGDPQARRDLEAGDTSEPQQAPAHYTIDDFAQLRYLEGDWVGSGYEGGPFYESYHFVNDSTIEMTAWTDSTLTTPDRRARYQLRGGVIGKDNGARLIGVDASGHHFQAEGYGWTFKSVSPDRWTAHLGGSTVYTMDRLRGR